MMSKDDADQKTRKQDDRAKRWFSYLISTSAAVTAGQANATIMYFDPFPDLVASDTDVDVESGVQQINVTFQRDYPFAVGGGSHDSGMPNKSDPDFSRPVFSSNAWVSGAAQPGPDGLILRPRDMGGDTASKSDPQDPTGKAGDAPGSVIGGANVRAALGLSMGDLIGPALDWTARGTDKDGQGQPMGAGNNQYLGFQWAAGGKGSVGPAGFNYGWLNYSYTENFPSSDPPKGGGGSPKGGGSITSVRGLSSVTLHDYAFETDLDTPISAGAGRQVSSVAEPGTLALLSLGASGIVALRRRRLVRAKANQAA